METKQEIIKKHPELVGKEIYAKVTRMGGKYKTIHSLHLYRISENGSMHYSGKVMPCVANRDQYDHFNFMTKDDGYFEGRPTLPLIIDKIKSGEIIAS